MLKMIPLILFGYQNFLSNLSRWLLWKELTPFIIKIVHPLPGVYTLDMFVTGIKYADISVPLLQSQFM